MPTPPTVEDVEAYLAQAGVTYAETDVESALDAETAAQAAVVRFPADPEAPADPLPYPSDLLEALLRRTHRLLTLRAIPLGYQQSATEFGTAQTRIGLDIEIRRLEAPHRKLVLG